MIKISANGKESQTLSNDQVFIITDALLHEMERYNKALDLVSDKDAQKALENAKHKVYEVFKAVNTFLLDEIEID